MSKRYCIRGHDTDVVGRVQRMCRECRRMSDRARYARSARRRAYMRNHEARTRVRDRIARIKRQILELLLGRESNA